MHIGYVYPAGGQQGSTFEAVVAGQSLGDVDHVYVSGDGVSATIKEMIRPMSGKERNDLRIQVDELLARKAVVTNDSKALEQFRSFKYARNIKHDTAADDKELEELKAKYAQATWTADDEKRLKELRTKLAMSFRRLANPAISELAVARSRRRRPMPSPVRASCGSAALGLVESDDVLRRPVAGVFQESVEGHYATDQCRGQDLFRPGAARPRRICGLRCRAW